MKMIVLFLFVFISGVFAGNANSQETKGIYLEKQ